MNKCLEHDPEIANISPNLIFKRIIPHGHGTI
jgi:hypothetical protein